MVKCKKCGKEFESKYGSIYCSDKCWYDGCQEQDSYPFPILDAFNWMELKKTYGEERVKQAEGRTVDGCAFCTKMILMQNYGVREYQLSEDEKQEIIRDFLND